MKASPVLSSKRTRGRVIGAPPVTSSMTGTIGYRLGSLRLGRIAEAVDAGEVRRSSASHQAMSRNELVRHESKIIGDFVDCAQPLGRFFLACRRWWSPSGLFVPVPAVIG